MTDGFEPKYLVTLDEIYHSHWAARKKRRIAWLREALLHFWPDGHPTRLIHITGTNGKGSVAHYLEQALSAEGGAGSWTGPHVFDYAERFHINGGKVSHEEITAIYRQVLVPYQDWFTINRDGDGLSFAELGILLSLHLFARHNLRWGVMEVGAGGRYTPLMALDMAACVLTNVGADHPKSLGAESWQRALDKAGIARDGVPFFTAAEGETGEYVVATAEAEGAPVRALEDRDLVAVAESVGDRAPAHLVCNLALALVVVRHFLPDLETGPLLARMRGRLPARFWLVAPNIVADVAHNADKIARFAQELQHHFPDRRFRFILGLTRSRQAREVFAALLPLADHILFTSASYAGQDPERLASELRAAFPQVSALVDPRQALRQEREKLREGEVLVLTGSAYMIDQALNPNPFIQHLNGTYGWRYPDRTAPGSLT